MPLGTTFIIVAAPNMPVMLFRKKLRRELSTIISGVPGTRIFLSWSRILNSLKITKNDQSKTLKKAIKKGVNPAE
jgi:hypothetical protein